ncbi:Hexaprenyldihydroxybenzoate methyltransferase, mitochondrial [Cryptotrichosporon argae]
MLRTQAARALRSRGHRAARSIASTASTSSPLFGRRDEAASSSSSSSFFASSPSPSSPASSAPSASNSAAGLNTVNAGEIAHFSRLSSQWWDETGEFALLHRMNPARVEYMRRVLALADEPAWTFAGRHADRARGEKTAGWLRGKRVLDVGCGGGLLAESLARLGGDVLAIDASESNIKIAQTHAAADPFLAAAAAAGSATGADGRGRLRYRHTAAETIRAEGGQFDVVCSMEVVEHVDEPAEFLRCLADMVKPGGHLFLSTISRTPLAQLLTLTLAEDVLRLVTPGTHTYAKFIKPAELRQFFHASAGGFDTWERSADASDTRKEVGSTQGIVYDPLGQAWRLWDAAEGTLWKEVGEQCNYMFHARKRADAK